MHAGIQLLQVYVLTPDQNVNLHVIMVAITQICYSSQYDLEIYAFISQFTCASLRSDFAH